MNVRRLALPPKGRERNDRAHAHVCVGYGFERVGGAGSAGAGCGVGTCGLGTCGLWPGGLGAGGGVGGYRNLWLSLG